MFTYVDETDEGVFVYQVRTYRFCLCWAFYNASEIFELTAIPFFYRKFIGVDRKPTFLEWLARHKSFWTWKHSYPKGTKITIYPKRIPRVSIGYLEAWWN